MKLIDYCTKMPKEDKMNEGHKFPFNACQLLCSLNGFNINRILLMEDNENDNQEKQDEKEEEEKKEEKKEEEKKEEDKKEEDKKDEDKKEEDKKEEKKR